MKPIRNALAFFTAFPFTPGPQDIDLRFGDPAGDVHELGAAAFGDLLRETFDVSR